MYSEKRNLFKTSGMLLLTGFTLLIYVVALSGHRMPKGLETFVSSQKPQGITNAVTLTNQAYEKNYYNDNKDLCLTLVYRYPVLTDANTEMLGEINRQIEAQKDKWIIDQQEMVKEVKQRELFCSTYGNEVNYSVTFNQDDIISILFEGYLFAGGAHGMPYRMPQTFRLSTGRLLSLSEVTGLTKQQVKDKVNEKFRELYEKNPEAYWDNARELVEKLSYEDYSYYVEQDGVHVYFDPYFVAPFAAGFVEIIL